LRNKNEKRERLWKGTRRRSNQSKNQKTDCKERQESKYRHGGRRKLREWKKEKESTTAWRRKKTKTQESVKKKAFLNGPENSPKKVVTTRE